MPDKANELAAPGAGEGLKGTLVPIDAIATNATVAKAITDQEAGYLLAVKANRPTLRAELKEPWETRCASSGAAASRCEHAPIAGEPGTPSGSRPAGPYQPARPPK